jgi:tetratricopeptide (TPR) repeat protein
MIISGHRTDHRSRGGIRSAGIRLISIFLLFSVVSGCNADTGSIWGIDTAEFLMRVRHGDREFLRHLDFRKVKLAEIRNAGEGAAWYLAHMFRDLGMEEIERQLLELEWEKGSGVFRRESGNLLISRQFDDENYREAEKLLQEYVKRYPEEPGAVKRLIESRYRQQEDDVVIRDLENLDRDAETPADIPAGGIDLPEEELILWEAVAKSRLGKPGWEELFRTLFYHYPASALHWRAWIFIDLSADRKSRFTEPELAMFSGKVKLYLQEYGNAAAAFGPLLVPEAPVELTPWIIREAGRSFLGAGKAAEGARALRALVPVLEGESLFAAVEMAGRLYRSDGAWPDAIELLEQALTLATQPGDYDRTLWYLLSSRVNRSPEAGAVFVRRYSELWHDPEYYSDVLGTLMTLLLARNRWDLVYEIYSVLLERGPASSVSAYAVTLAGAVRSGRFTVPGRTRGETMESLYRSALDSRGALYYRLIAAAALGEKLRLEDRSFRFPEAGDPGTAENPDDGTRRTKKNEPVYTEADLVAGFFTYGLHRYGYEAAVRFAGVLRPEDLYRAGLELAKGGYYLESLRLQNRAFRSVPLPYSREALEALYPRGYLQHVRTVTEREKIPESLFYGLIKEESYFDSDVISHAGAVGLSQLMPATAADIAGRMRLKDPDLTDPAVNLAIGARYLAMLLERYREPVYALAGYNAGWGRIGTWINQWNDMPLELFVERIPYAETREYIRKVLVAAVMYGYLYEGRSVNDMVRFFFPKIALE